MKQNRQKMIARAAWFLALTVAVLLPLSPQAELLEAKLQVNGMTCPFCAFGIEKKLRDLEGVKEVEVLLDEGIVHLSFQERNTATVHALQQAIDRSGFRLSGLNLDVRGILQRDDTDPVLYAGENLRFRLLEMNKGRVQPASEDTLKKLQPVSGDGMLVVNGTVHSPTDDLPGLLIGGADSANGEVQSSQP